jgi:phage repressor protein C with HTH and peptisase S24 domain
VVEELLLWEGELMRREEALAMRENNTRISKQGLIQVSAALVAEQAKADAAWLESLDKVEAQTTHSENVLDLDKILVEDKVELDGWSVSWNCARRC